MAEITEINKNLMAAAHAGDLFGVIEALESGAKINFSTFHNFPTASGAQIFLCSTALGVSVYFGHLEVVQYLVEAGANPFLPFSAMIPIELARLRKHEVVEKYLDAIMKYPRWLNKIDETTGFTPLTDSIFYTDLQQIKALVDCGADVCKMDKHRKTPLIYAMEKNSLEIVIILLEKGAIATCLSALKWALDFRSNDMVKCLIQYKPSLVKVFLDNGFTPLTKSISTCNLEIVKYLIKNGADPIQSDRNGNSPLEKALETPYIEIAKMLVLKGAKVPRSMNETLFHQVAEDANVEIYKFLMQNEWDVNQVDQDGKTALALSASKENLLLSLFLIENGAKLQLAEDDVVAFKNKNSDFNWCLQRIIITRE